MEKNFGLKLWGSWFDQYPNTFDEYQWFSTGYERELFIKAVSGLAKTLGKTLCYHRFEGRDHITVKLDYRYKGVDYHVDYDYGYGFTKEDAHYIFTEGVFASDGNIATFIDDVYPGFLETVYEDDEIDLVNIEVVVIKRNPYC